MNIPFVDLNRQYLRIKEEIDEAIAGVIRDSAYVGGDRVMQFEHDFAEWLGAQHVVACANGTDSIEMLLDAFGVGPGDEVIVPALSWISTAEAVGTRGATPVFVDIDDTYCIDVTKIEAKITPRTKGIIPVHLYGCPADMPPIMAIAKQHSLFVLEDCAQAHGAMINGQKVGTIGHAASFSFYPGKNLGAYGDAGCIATKDGDIAMKVRMIANHGQPQKHKHLIEGRNSRMDGIHAAVLSVKLRHLDKWTEERISLANLYCIALKEADMILPKTPADKKHVFHLFVVRSQRRDEIRKNLSKVGISTAIHYPTPLPLMDCYHHLEPRREEFQNAIDYTSQILSIPIFAELRPSELDIISQQLI